MIEREFRFHGIRMDTGNDVEGTSVICSNDGSAFFIAKRKQKVDMVIDKNENIRYIGDCTWYKIDPESFEIFINSENIYEYSDDPNRKGSALMQLRDCLLEDTENMENAMSKMSMSANEIWQNKLLYALCKAVFDLLKYVLRKL